MIPFLCIITGLDIEFHFYKCQRMTGQEKKILQNRSEKDGNLMSQHQNGRDKQTKTMNLENITYKCF